MGPVACVRRQYALLPAGDALPPKLRLRILRFLAPFALGRAVAVSLVLRLPTAEDTPGELVWTVMGTDTVTNLQALTYSSTVLTLLLAKGVLRSWVFPNMLSFIHIHLDVVECVSSAARCIQRRCSTRTASGARFECERCAVPSRSKLARVRPLRFAC